MLGRRPAHVKLHRCRQSTACCRVRVRRKAQTRTELLGDVARTGWETLINNRWRDQGVASHSILRDRDIKGT